MFRVNPGQQSLPCAPTATRAMARACDENLLDHRQTRPYLNSHRACSLPPATAGVPYSQTLSVSGGVAPYIWSSNSQLPAGLSISPDGVFPARRSRGAVHSSFGSATLAVRLTTKPVARRQSALYQHHDCLSPSPGHDRSTVLATNHCNRGEQDRIVFSPRLVTLGPVAYGDGRLERQCRIGWTDILPIPGNRQHRRLGNKGLQSDRRKIRI